MSHDAYWFVVPVHEILLKDSATPNRDGLTKAKVLSMVTLGVSALICAVLPIAIVKCLTKGKGLGRKGSTCMDVLLRFGGGILLATTFMHLLPEVREGYEDLLEANESLKSWPENLPELIMCVGFFIMYGIEEVAHKCLHKHHSHSHGSTQEDMENFSHGQHNHHVIESGGTPFRGLLIIIALSVHQIFEGLAIGLEQDTSHVWILLGAVAAHKLVIAFCVGFEISSAKISFLAGTACVSIFAIASPIGIGIGIALSSGAQPSETIDIASVILQGMATGTLLFVVFFEVLTKSRPEKSSTASDPGLLYFFSTLVGFILMTILLSLVTD